MTQRSLQRSVTHGGTIPRAQLDSVARREASRREATAAGGLQISESRRGSTRTIGLEGEFDLAGVPAVRQVLAGTLERGVDCLVFDLSGLSFMDSSGVDVMVELWEHSAAQNFCLKIVPGARAVQRVFEICQLHNVLPFTVAT
jgi:anti-anti-sigma factor